ncbi:MAG: Holliday junction branch migration protein RuvA [Lachnospiraceae bacterium]|nr:Holliday junction branch migration protein RuvA [Lachnospiraceae bacterium]
MISYIRGEILYCTDSSVVVDVGSVGMEVNVTSQTLAAMEMASGTVEFYTYLHVKEDALTLYGFNSRNELKLFKMLITVSGIGPKSALGILSQISVENLISAILSEDSATIAKTPGVGAKSAGKIVLELKDKLTFEDMLKVGNTDGMLHGVSETGSTTGEGSDIRDEGNWKKQRSKQKNSKNNTSTDQVNGTEQGGRSGNEGNAGIQLQENKNEAIQALSALGYSISDAMKAVRSIELEPGMTTEDILRLSLKYL